ncbi:hypothetical protein [Catellatospora sp. NPDC049609]|uniref:hypothetical protein n=1 Tax=Catellatospora sp. NPDC049609 TaxID=3155505 RepID=UPI00341FB89D
MKREVVRPHILSRLLFGGVSASFVAIAAVMIGDAIAQRDYISACIGLSIAMGTLVMGWRFLRSGVVLVGSELIIRAIGRQVSIQAADIDGVACESWSSTAGFTVYGPVLQLQKRTELESNKMVVIEILSSYNENTARSRTARLRHHILVSKMLSMQQTFV